MKLAYLALIPAALLAAPVAAQSLHETHERVWMPAGKSHIVTWRMRDRAPQVAHVHHQAGKGMMPARHPSQPEQASQASGVKKAAGSD